MSFAAPPTHRPGSSQLEPFWAGVAHAGCRLLGDTSESHGELVRRFNRYHVPARMGEDRQLRLSLPQDDLPRLELRSHSRAYRYDDIAVSGPEWRRFVHVPHPSRRLLADTVLGQEAMLEVMPGYTRILRPERWPLYALLAWHWLLLQDRSHCSIHAAVTAFQGTALVVISSTGTGKSTLAHALYSQGADYFSDEEAWFSLPSYQLYPLVKDLFLRPGGLEVLDLPDDGRSWHEVKPGDPKHVVRLPRPSHSCPEDNVRLIFLEGFAGRPELRRMGGGEASRLLFRHLGFGSAVPGERMAVAGALANRYPSYGLRVGAPGETAALLLRQVATLP